MQNKVKWIRLDLFTELHEIKTDYVNNILKVSSGEAR